MLAVLRFSFSKELKFIRSRLGKPYNSALGECMFRLAAIIISIDGRKPPQVNTSDALGDYLPYLSIMRPKSRSFALTFTYPYPANHFTVDKVEVAGSHLF